MSKSYKVKLILLIILFIFNISLLGFYFVQLINVNKIESKTVWIVSDTVYLPGGSDPLDSDQYYAKYDDHEGDTGILWGQYTKGEAVTVYRNANMGRTTDGTHGWYSQERYAKNSIYLGFGLALIFVLVNLYLIRYLKKSVK